MMHLTKSGIEKRMMYVPSLEIQKSIIERVENERRKIRRKKRQRQRS
jgi:hypothetical protein